MWMGSILSAARTVGDVTAGKLGDWETGDSAGNPRDCLASLLGANSIPSRVASSFPYPRPRYLYSHCTRQKSLAVMSCCLSESAARTHAACAGLRLSFSFAFCRFASKNA